jgi:membrane protease subunit (stomatin/prohibitin family)
METLGHNEGKHRTMTKKRLGYVELEWTCPNCATRNPGPNKFCNGCGAPQPENVEFEQALEEKLVTDKDLIARAQAGPDVHCPFCGARNAGGAKFCGECGGDLAGAAARDSGRVVGAHRREPAADVICPTCGTANPASNRSCSNCGAPLAKAPMPAPTPSASGKAARKGLPLIALLGGGLLCVVAAAVLFGLLTKTEDLTGQVTAVSWERSIPVLALVPVEREGWRDEIPGDAEVGACRQEQRYASDEPVSNATEVCGTPYTVDTGTGVGEVVQDCVYEVYDDRCTFTAMDWEVSNVVTLTGSDLDPRWPEPSLTGDQRQGEPTEAYTVTFAAGGDTYTYAVDDAGSFSQFALGSSWVLHVNALGGITSVEAAR